MTGRTPEAELHPSYPVVLIAPLWVAKPVFHVLDHGSWSDPDVDDRWGPRIGDLADTTAPWRFNVVATRCGHLLRANWWLEPLDHGPAEHTGSFTHPHTTTELRFDHAASFARPCRRCWPDTPPQT